MLLKQISVQPPLVKIIHEALAALWSGATGTIDLRPQAILLNIQQPLQSQPFRVKTLTLRCLERTWSAFWSSTCLLHLLGLAIFSRRDVLVQA